MTDDMDVQSLDQVMKIVNVMKCYELEVVYYETKGIVIILVIYRPKQNNLLFIDVDIRCDIIVKRVGIRCRDRQRQLRKWQKQFGKQQEQQKKVCCNFSLSFKPSTNDCF